MGYVDYFFWVIFGGFCAPLCPRALTIKDQISCSSVWFLLEFFPLSHSQWVRQSANALVSLVGGRPWVEGVYGFGASGPYTLVPGFLGELEV